MFRCSRASRRSSAVTWSGYEKALVILAVLSVRSSEGYRIELDPKQESVRGVYAVPGEVQSVTVLSRTGNWHGKSSGRIKCGCSG